MLVPPSAKGTLSLAVRPVIDLIQSHFPIHLQRQTPSDATPIVSQYLYTLTMFGLRQLTIFCAALCAAASTRVQAETAAASVPRSLRVQDSTAVASRQLETKNPGGILGPLYAAFPNLLLPLALLSDTVHNTNAALTGVQHTPDGIFQA